MNFHEVIMTVRPTTLTLLLLSALIMACESDRITETRQAPGGVPRVDPRIFTTLSVVPSTVTLEQEEQLQLEIYAQDQRGAYMADTGGVTFYSSDSAVARVSSKGMVTAGAVGTADILVTKIIAGVARIAKVKATIFHANALGSLILTADLSRGWQPAVAHMKAGGTVQWVIAGPLSWSEVPHEMLYLMDSSYTITDSLDLRTGAATRKLLTPGILRYCSAGCWDPPDHGVVYVH